LIFQIIEKKRDEWLNSESCQIKGLVSYMLERSKLRDAQIEAIKTYLFLKIKHRAHPLWELFSEAVFCSVDIPELPLSRSVKEKLYKDPALAMLYEFASKEVDGKPLSEKTLNAIQKNPDKINASQFWKEYFYDISYTDYLFSLPMGAGKTYLMAAFIYLDLYFARNEPNNKAFAHNFIILAPSGLKSSVVPSLRTIQEFDPSWVIPEPAASELKKLLKFEVLDEQSSAKRSNRVRNPNVQKIALHQPFDRLFGLVVVTNAEKVILDRITVKDLQTGMFDGSEDERDRQANELRNLLGKIANFSVFVDEVHHAATDEIKLRAVINNWAKAENFHSVISFTGTPFLSKKEQFTVSDNLKIAMQEITNVVYYYPLTQGIGNFLKVPKVKVSTDRNRLNIIEDGLRRFLDTYLDTVYDNGTTAKIAIYCGRIKTLEEEVYPLVEKIAIEYGLNPDTAILKYYRSVKGYSLSVENDALFAALDQPFSKVRIILLVQIGKEGWDCRSLTGVILSQTGDSPKNMVLQTSCRCLRQVERNNIETALIVLNDGNAQTLNAQLEKQHKTNLVEFQKGRASDMVSLKRYNRIPHLKLPEISYYQLIVQYSAIVNEGTLDVESSLASSVEKSKSEDVLTWTQDLEGRRTDVAVLEKERGERPLSYNAFISDILRSSFSAIRLNTLAPYEEQLKKLYDTITFIQDDVRYLSSNYNYKYLLSAIRKSFIPKRTLNRKEEFIKGSVALLDIARFTPQVDTSHAEKYIPGQKLCENIILHDKGELTLTDDDKKLAKQLEQMGHSDLAQQLIDKNTVPSYVDSTYHYLPYKMDSNFEIRFLEKVLALEVFSDKKLEIYYNGDDELTELKIRCYKKKGAYQYIGSYTPDFLIISRDKSGKSIYKALIVETKGKIYANDPVFQKKKSFMEEIFCKENNERYKYKRFDYLYLEDSISDEEQLSSLTDTINTFFVEEN
jgi:superfamily II DNA or RNA helicase